MIRPMKQGFLALCASCTLGVAIPASAQSNFVAAAPKAAVSVKVGESQDVNTRYSFAKIKPTDPAIISALAIGKNQISVRGTRAGQASILLYNAEGSMIDVVTVQVNAAIAPQTPTPQSVRTSQSGSVEQKQLPKLVTQEVRIAPVSKNLLAGGNSTEQTRTVNHTGQTLIDRNLDRIQQARASATYQPTVQKAAYTNTAPRQITERNGYDFRENIQVTINQSEPARTKGTFNRIVVSQPEIADAMPVSDTQMFIRGKSIGTTNVLTYNSKGKLVDVMRVSVGHDLDAVSADLRALFPQQNFQLNRVANKIHIRGSVPDPVTASLVLDVLESYAPDQIINAMTIDSPQQVMLEVRFVEASREAIKDIGLGNEISRAGDFSFSSSGSLASGMAAKTTGFLFGGSGDVAIDLALNALEEKGVIRTLAEPNLVARSGETASFLAGGEFPIPVAADDGQITIEFRQFGVSLAFTPTVLAGDQMSLKVVPEVSQLDSRNSIRLSGIEIPALSVRKADTTVELRDGQSFAVAGLIQSNYDNTAVQTPLVGDMPILGALFRSSRFRRNETELVIVITPRLVQAVTNRENLTDPFAYTREPTQPELFFQGRVEGEHMQEFGHAVHMNTEAMAMRARQDPNPNRQIDQLSRPLSDAVGRYQAGEVYAPKELRTSPVNTASE